MTRELEPLPGDPQPLSYSLQAASGGWAGTLGNVTFVGILGTFLSFSAACEGNSQGLDFPGSLGTRLGVPSPSPSALSLSSSLRGSALSKVRGER